MCKDNFFSVCIKLFLFDLCAFVHDCVCKRSVNQVTASAHVNFAAQKRRSICIVRICVELSPPSEMTDTLKHAAAAAVQPSHHRSAPFTHLYFTQTAVNTDTQIFFMHKSFIQTHTIFFTHGQFCCNNPPILPPPPTAPADEQV